MFSEGCLNQEFGVGGCLFFEIVDITLVVYTLWSNCLITMDYVNYKLLICHWFYNDSGAIGRSHKQLEAYPGADVNRPWGGEWGGVPPPG